ncbi:hypothetical protein [Salipaludibacillus daqingensis]|uniref:hypothetical protein n=1 Tax=Salipaludibacillus daqingensis TaxID=3041001 RepID=UPI002473B609|nr:hypothetical protein [Salipaludibacillus daqingensis]
MFKKMFISMIIMTIFIVGSLVYFFHESVGDTLGRTGSLENKLEKTFENEDYYFYLSDQEIRKAIEKGTTSIELVEDFLLEKEEEATLSEAVFAYIETPYFSAIKESRKLYDHFGRRPIPEEIKQELMDQYLPIHVRFNENKGYVYDIHLKQGEEEVEPIRTMTSGSGTLKTIYLEVEDLDFAQSAIVVAEDKVNSSVSTQFKVDFSEFK